MNVVYVAGRYRDGRGPFYIQQNILAARAAAVKVWQMGLAAFCPHLNSALFDGAAKDETFLAAGLEFIRRSDVVFVFDPNWKLSKGTVAEVQFATEIGKPVVFSLESLQQWQRIQSGEQMTLPGVKV